MKKLKKFLRLIKFAILLGFSFRIKLVKAEDFFFVDNQQQNKTFQVRLVKNEPQNVSNVQPTTTNQVKPSVTTPTRSSQSSNPGKSVTTSQPSLPSRPSHLGSNTVEAFPIQGRTLRPVRPIYPVELLGSKYPELPDNKCGNPVSEDKIGKSFKMNKRYDKSSKPSTSSNINS